MAWQRPATKIENVPRLFVSNSQLVLVSGQLFLIGGLVIPAGQLISAITFFCATTGAVGQTNLWFALYDRDTLALQAVTVDDGATGWAAGTFKTLALSTAFTPAVDTEVYAGVCQVVVPGNTSGIIAANSRQNMSGAAPFLCEPADAGLTTPATAPAVATPTGIGSAFSPWVSLE
jgi:hypothetical protein